MFYLGLENQIHLLIILIFSSYIYLSSLAVKQHLPFTKHFGTAFFIPLTLCLLSFFSIQSARASLYLFFAEFFLITGLVLVMAFEKNTELTNVVLLLLYALPLGVVLLNGYFDVTQPLVVFHLIALFYLGIMIIMMISSTLQKKNSRLSLYWGIIAICVSLLIRNINALDITLSLSLFIKAMGYLLFFTFFYRSTIQKLEQAHSESTAQLDRINQSVQREVTRRVEEIERSNRKLLEISKTDGLTGAFTKKAIIELLDSMVEKSGNKEFSILMFDIDKFKTINDTHGHIVGDKCIKSLVTIARSSLRGDDKLGRYGGDEFIIILPETSPVKAYLVAERFRKNVEKSTNPYFTVSIGVASFPLDARNSKGLIDAADKALYKSKERGRNAVTHTSQVKELQ